MIVSCLQCGHKFKLIKHYHDELGDFTVCPECDGSFDIDISYEKFMEDLLMEQQEQM